MRGGVGTPTEYAPVSSPIGYNISSLTSLTDVLVTSTKLTSNSSVMTATVSTRLEMQNVCMLSAQDTVSAYLAGKYAVPMCVLMHNK